MRISDWSSDVCSSDLSFAVVGEELLQKRAKKLAAGTATRERRLFEKDLEPYVGGRPVAEVTAPELLAALRRIEARGAVETAHRARTLAAQVFRYAIAHVRAARNPAVDLIGALAHPEGKQFDSPTETPDVAPMLRALDGTYGIARALCRGKGVQYVSISGLPG